MSLSIVDFLLHIRDELVFLKTDAEGYAFEQFSVDKKTILSYTRSLEIIGEACKNIPGNVRLAIRKLTGKALPD